MCHTLAACTSPAAGRHIDSALSGVPVDQRCHCKAATQEEFNKQGGGGGGCSAQ